VAEAARVIRSGGVVAFADWVEGPTELSIEEAQRALSLMSFANVLDIPGYVRLLSNNGCGLRKTRDLAEFFDLGLNMIETQLTYDVLATVQFRTDVLKIITDKFRFSAVSSGRAN